MADKVSIEIDIDLELYFQINEMARKEGMLLDAFIEKILREYIEKHEKELR